MSSSQLATILIRLRRRLRLQDGWLLAQRTVWISLAGSLSVMIAGRLWPIEQLWLWTRIPILLWLCAVLVYSIFRPQKLTQIAQRVDLELDLKERLSTAFELESKSNPQFFALPDYLQKDALTAAQTIHPSKAFPLYWLRRPLMVAAGILVAAIVLAYLPNPMEAVLDERAAVEQAAQKQAKNIEDLKEEIEQSSELSPEMQAELLRQLEELAQQLRDNPGDREKALADLSKLEQELRRQLDPNIDLRQASLEAIASQFQFLAEQDNANPPIPSEALKQIANELENMSETERQDLAEALAQMAAQAAQSGDQTLAQALAAMSQAALSNDSAAVSQAASNDIARQWHKPNKNSATNKRCNKRSVNCKTAVKPWRRLGKQASRPPDKGQDKGTPGDKSRSREQYLVRDRVDRA